MLHIWTLRPFRLHFHTFYNLSLVYFFSLVRQQFFCDRTNGIPGCPDWANGWLFCLILLALFYNSDSIFPVHLMFTQKLFHYINLVFGHKIDYKYISNSSYNSTEDIRMKG